MSTPYYFLLGFLIVGFLAGWFGVKNEIGDLIFASIVAFAGAIIISLLTPFSYEFRETTFELVDSGSYVTVLTPEQSFETRNMEQAFNWKDQNKKGYIRKGYNFFGGNLPYEKQFIKK